MASTPEERRLARAHWPIRAHPLGEDPPDDLPAETTGAERLAIAWRLSLEAWTLTGRPLPDYDRAHAPVRLWGTGERPAEND